MKLSQSVLLTALRRVILWISLVVAALNETTLHAQGVCLNTEPADVVIMIDRTGSLSEADLQSEKDASKRLLDIFSEATVRPRVAVGTFNRCFCRAGDLACSSDVCAANAARMLSSLTTNYGTRVPSSGLYSTIDSIVGTRGRTDISQAITVAQNTLGAVAGTRRFIVVISDGVPNLPPTSCGICGCSQSYNAASSAASSAEATPRNTKIIGIHYTGSNDVDVCSLEPQRGFDFMRNDIASSPALFFQGNDDLTGVFEQVSQTIGCDDKDICTFDACNEATSACTYTPITTDVDNDGVRDCLDRCPGGIDSDLGRSCSIEFQACRSNGTFVCALEEGGNGQGGSAIVCDAPPIETSQEICDRKDNDCNGIVDDGFNVGETCSAGVGECNRSGAFQCVAGGGSTQCSATPGAPSAEICNNKDDNCNGVIDDVATVGDVCSVGLGECRSTGSLVCTPGAPAPICSAVPGIPTDEICDGKDNDCDGEVDEGFNVGSQCSVGAGQCARSGIVRCSLDQRSSECSAVAGDPSVELCNGTDDDCNGAIDNGFDLGASCTVGIGACQGTGARQCAIDGSVRCSAVPGVPQAEICTNGIDDDCDGAVNEGCPPPSLVDCAGTEGGEAAIDRCGVCGGDGSSCLQCEVVDVSPVLFALDSGALRQRAIVSLLLAPVLEKGTRRDQQIAQRIKLESVNLFEEIWAIIWTSYQRVIPVNCANPNFCRRVDITAYRKELEVRANRLLQLATNASRRARNYMSRPRQRALLRQATQSRQEAQRQVERLPQTKSVCDLG